MHDTTLLSALLLTTAFLNVEVGGSGLSINCKVRQYTRTYILAGIQQYAKPYKYYYITFSSLSVKGG